MNKTHSSADTFTNSRKRGLYMSHLVDFFTARFGSGGNVIVGLIFLVAALLGVLIALKGRQIMVLVVGFCAVSVGILCGAAFGLLTFDSFIIMLITAFIGGTALLLLVKFVKGVGYFIGIGALTFFIAFVITSELYIDSTRITENTLVFFDLIAGVVMGILAAFRSKYLVTAITAIAGGLITSISVLSLFGVYFADWRMWCLALVIAVFGVFMQIKVYDFNGSKKHR